MWKCKGAAKAPVIEIDKDLVIWIHTAPALHGTGNFTVAPHELFGFNTGEFELKQFSDEHSQPY